jgi:hypothetical protein
MKDGYLNKCKDCAKKDSKERDSILKNNPDWIEKEKTRAREKYHRLYSDGRHKPTPEKKKISIQRYKEKYPEKTLAKNASYRMQKTSKENEFHHWSYNKEHYKDVIELSVKDHAKLHRYLIYDQERMMYRRTDNNLLLDTRELHENYFNEIKNKE